MPALPPQLLSGEPKFIECHWDRKALGRPDGR